MSEPGYLAHFVPGRLRLKLPARQGDAEYLEQLRERLLTLPEVDAVSVNPATGSVLLSHSWPSLAEFARASQEHDLFELTEHRIEPVLRRARSYLGGVGERLEVAQPTGANRSLLQALLLLLGLLQLARGQVLAPATTLFWYALELSGREGEGGDS